MFFVKVEAAFFWVYLHVYYGYLRQGWAWLLYAFSLYDDSRVINKQWIYYVNHESKYDVKM